MTITLAEHHNLKGLAKQQANTSIIEAFSCIAYIARKTTSQLHLSLLREITFLYLQIVLGRH